MDPAAKLRDATAKHSAAEKAEKAERGKRDGAITDALDYGIRPGIVSEITGLSREQVRRIATTVRKRRRKPSSAE